MNYAASLADPAGSSSLVAAVTWLQATLLGTIATTLAVIGVASIGLRMLTGRTNLRQGTTIVCGCFIVLGAASITAGLRSAVDGLELPPIVRATPTDPPPAYYVTVPAQYDPYAGAAVFR